MSCPAQAGCSVVACSLPNRPDVFDSINVGPILLAQCSETFVWDCRDNINVLVLPFFHFPRISSGIVVSGSVFVFILSRDQMPVFVMCRWVFVCKICVFKTKSRFVSFLFWDGNGTKNFSAIEHTRERRPRVHVLGHHQSQHITRRSSRERLRPPSHLPGCRGY